MQGRRVSEDGDVFLEDLYVTCEECGGKRYKPEALRISYKGKNVNDILNMTVDEALDFF